VDNNGDITLGFAVSWSILEPGAHPSSTAWSGRILHTEPNQMQTTWTLTSLKKAAWKSVRVNTNTFHKE
jgi:hypothetical protein